LASTNLISSRGVRWAIFSQRLRAASPDPGGLMSTMRDTRGSTLPTSSAPLVSSDTE